MFRPVQMVLAGVPIALNPNSGGGWGESFIVLGVILALCLALFIPTQSDKVLDFFLASGGLVLGAYLHDIGTKNNGG